MILGPLKRSQAGTQDCDNHPASPHHQKPVESSPSRPPRSNLSLLPRLIKEAEIANKKTDDPQLTRFRALRLGFQLSPYNPSFISPDQELLESFTTPRHTSPHPHTMFCSPLSCPPRAGGYTQGSSASCQSLHTYSVGGPVSSYVHRRRTEDRAATSGWSVRSSLLQTEPDSQKAVPVLSSSWTHPSIRPRGRRRQQVERSQSFVS